MMVRIMNYSLVVILITLLSIGLISCGGNGGSQTVQEKDTAQVEKAEFEPGDAEQGKTFYVQFCSACHGPDALGVKGLGKDLVHSEFMAGLTDEEMLKYVNEGRAIDDPRNTTGIPMPPKGGNPALTDQQIMHIIAYLRTIQDVPETEE
jgi:disulfide bond formation protein DsbB